MKNDKHEQNELQRMMEGRAARMIAAAVTVFLCVLTLFVFVALKMEWNVPALAVLSGDNGLWTREYQREELVMDGSTENILLADDGETPLTGSGENAKTNVGENGSGGTAQTGENAGNGEDLQVEGTEAVRQEETETPDVSGTGKAEADVKETQTPEFSYYIRINRKQNCVTIYTQDEEGEYTVPYKAMVCSTGLYNATPRGTYQISTKYLWRELYGGVYGQYATRIHGGILFHSVPYYKRAKDTLCTDKYNKLGQQASMGCVRLTVEDAKWIAENCPEGTTVEIYDGEDPGPLGKPEAQKLDKSDPDCHWDPTDPDEENPWQQTETSVTESEQEKQIK